jgi:hypothetical protein
VLVSPLPAAALMSTAVEGLREEAGQQAELLDAPVARLSGGPNEPDTP